MKHLWMMLLLLTPAAYAREYEMKLLAVDDSGRGSVADLTLEVKPGSGRVFIDTFPLTRIDTQISTRYARSIACDQLSADCSSRDFFYTIRSNSVIVGGPSAGGALAVITIAALENYELDEKTAITGTINSGGLIGPVGGLEPKLQAAAEQGITKVLIPSGERFIDEDNHTRDLYKTGSELGLQVMEAATVNDALYEFTGKTLKQADRNFTRAAGYEQTMNAISYQLCNRTKSLMQRTSQEQANLSIQAQNLSMRGQEAVQDGQYYSAASFCFGANIALSRQILIEQNVTVQGLQERINREQKKLLEMKEKVGEYKISTLTDLQTYEIVMERILDAEDFLLGSVEALEEDNRDSALYNFAYAVERYNSAVSWSRFFGTGSGQLDINEDTVRDSCIQKLAEAEERYQYVQLYTPAGLADTRESLDRAQEDRETERYELCLFKASKAKAEADIVLSALSITQENLESHLETKLGLVRDLIARQQEQGHFPILGYSYYEYANSLQGSDPYSALLYSEYALELSNLDLYFVPSRQGTGLHVDPGLVYAFILGTLFGMALLNIVRKTLANTRP